MVVKVKQAVSKTPDSPINDEKMEHPAQGCVVVTKPSYSGDGKVLFGSNLKHGNVVRVQVCTADGYRGLHYDRHHPNKVICEFDFSEAQWASFVSSIGIGNGVPCTFNYRPAEDYKLEKMPEMEVEPMIEKFAREIDESGKEYVREIKDAVEDIEKLVKSGSRAGLTDKLEKLRWKLENLPGNMAFIQKQLGEAMHDTVEAGKAELEAFARNTLVRAGMEKMLEQPRVQVIDVEEAKALPKKDK